MHCYCCFDINTRWSWFYGVVEPNVWSVPFCIQAEPNFDAQVPEPGQELGAIGSPTSAPEAAAVAKAPPTPGAKDTSAVHLTRVHEVQGTGLFERSYTLYTLQYELSWLASPSGECDRRYSQFEALHGRSNAHPYACTHSAPSASEDCVTHCA